MQVDDGGSLVLSLIDDAQCDVVAAMFASVQRSARDRIKTPYPGSRYVGAVSVVHGVQKVTVQSGNEQYCEDNFE